MNALMTLIEHHRDAAAAAPLRNRQGLNAEPLDTDNALYEQPIALDHLVALKRRQDRAAGLVESQEDQDTEDDNEDPEVALERLNQPNRDAEPANLIEGELATPGVAGMSDKRADYLAELEEIGRKWMDAERLPDKMVVYTNFPSHFEYMKRVRSRAFDCDDRQLTFKRQVFGFFGISALFMSGATKAGARKTVIEAFEKAREFTVLVISSVGIAGLNLQCANILVIFVSRCRISIANVSS